MDIALELVDTYVLDKVYASLLPAKIPSYNINNGLHNSTIYDLKASSPWQFEPASSMISFTPGEAAYMSQWNRDNIYRQAVSLFFITW
jgi:lathosterol oxidase